MFGRATIDSSCRSLWHNVNLCYSLITEGGRMYATLVYAILNRIAMFLFFLHLIDPQNKRKQICQHKHETYVIHLSIRDHADLFSNEAPPLSIYRMGFIILWEEMAIVYRRTARATFVWLLCGLILPGWMFASCSVSCQRRVFRDDSLFGVTGYLKISFGLWLLTSRMAK